MNEVLFNCFCFVVGVLIASMIMWEDVTTMTYGECNLVKPSGTVCVVEYGYTFEEKQP